MLGHAVELSVAAEWTVPRAKQTRAARQRSLGACALAALENLCPQHFGCLKIKSGEVMYACSDSVPSAFCLVLPTVEGTSTGLTILLTLAWKNAVSSCLNLRC